MNDNEPKLGAVVSKKIKSPLTKEWRFNSVHIMLTLIGFGSGALFNAFTIAENIATKPYVDKGLEINRKYTDEKSAAALREALDHSDANRQETMIQMQSYGADVKAQGVKLDLVLESVRQLQSQYFPHQRK